MTILKTSQQKRSGVGVRLWACIPIPIRRRRSTFRLGVKERPLKNVAMFADCSAPKVGRVTQLGIFFTFAVFA
jgi:hypothetical protein